MAYFFSEIIIVVYLKTTMAARPLPPNDENTSREKVPL